MEMVIEQFPLQPFYSKNSSKLKMRKLKYDKYSHKTYYMIRYKHGLYVF